MNRIQRTSPNLHTTKTMSGETQVNTATTSLSKSLGAVTTQINNLASGISSENLDPTKLNELQGLAHKQQLIMQAFQLISNVLASLRQTMARIIQNIR